MPDLHYTSLSIRKPTPQIIFETMRLAERLAASDKQNKEYYRYLTENLVERTSQFCNERGYASLLHFMAVEFIHVNNRLHALQDIMAEKVRLREDTRHRDVWIRTGNLKIWIEAQLPKETISGQLEHIGLQLEILSRLLDKMRLELEKTPCHDKIGVPYRESTLEHPLSIPLLSPLLIMSNVQDAIRRDEAHTTSEPIRQAQGSFLRNFSMFHTEAGKIAAVDATLAQSALDRLRENYQPAAQSASSMSFS